MNKEEKWLPSYHLSQLRKKRIISLDLPDFFRQFSCGLLQLRLILSYGWHKWRPNTGCGWFCSQLTQVPAAGYELRLSRVLAPGYKLRLTPSNGWLEFQWLNTSYGWSHPPVDSSSGDWIRVAAHSSSSGWMRGTADSILLLTRVPAAGYELQLIPSCGWLRVAADSSSTSWTRLAGDLYLNISSKFKDLFCKTCHFMVCFLLPGFSYHWFWLWLLLQEPWRSFKKLQEAWESRKKLQDSSCNWF